MGYEKDSAPTRLPAGSSPRHRTKGIIAGVAAAVAAGVMPVANAEIELGEGLAVTGFVDMSLYSNDSDGASAAFGID